MAELEQPLTEDGSATEGSGEKAQEGAETAGVVADAEGLMLHGVVRTRGHEKALAKLAVAAGEDLIEHQGLGALVHPVPYRLPDWNTTLIRQHSSAVERAMRRCTIVPAPYGVIFRDQRQVVDFLDHQHVALDEALSFLDGAFEMRLHVRTSGRSPGLGETELEDRAASCYTSLRRRSRAAFTIPPAGDGLLSAAFLVNKGEWVSFVEHADEIDAEHPEFQFDLTGPWPPYDFVRMAFFPRERQDDE